MIEQIEILLVVSVLLRLCYSEQPVVKLTSKKDCTTYILVHNVLQIEWFADSLLNCTVEVDTIKTWAEYEYLCITPKTLYFPNCAAKVSVYEKYASNSPLMVTNCVNNLDPTFCTSGENPYEIRFAATERSAAHAVFKVEGRNREYSPSSDDEEESFNSDALVTQIVLAIGVIMVVLAIAICILLSCRNLRYRNCDTSSQRSSPRTVQTEVVEGETTRPVSMAPELDSLIGSCHKHPGSIASQTGNRNTPPPSYWDVLDDDATVKS